MTTKRRKENRKKKELLRELRQEEAKENGSQSPDWTTRRSKELIGEAAEEAKKNGPPYGMWPTSIFAEKWARRSVRTVNGWREEHKFPGLFKWVGTHWECDVDVWLKNYVKDQPSRPRG